MKSKQCPNCHQTKPLGEFYKDPRYRAGVRTVCKFCTNEASKAQYWARKEKNFDIPVDQIRKRCKSCGEEKPGTAFNRNYFCADTLHNYCRECGKEKAEGSARKRREDSPKNVVYFLQAQESGFIKIGYASNLYLRLKAITGAWEPLEVIGLISDSTQRREEEIQLQFRAALKHGEWYYPVPDLIAFIEENCE